LIPKIPLNGNIGAFLGFQLKNEICNRNISENIKEGYFHLEDDFTDSYLGKLYLTLLELISMFCLRHV